MPSFDSTYSIIVRIYGKIYAVCVIFTIAGLFLWNMLRNFQLLSNSYQLLDSALEGSTIISGTSLLVTLIYQYSRSENFPQLYNVIDQVDEKVNCLNI